MKTNKYNIIEVDSKYSGLRLDKFLYSIFTNASNILIQKALRNKDILLNEESIKDSGIRLKNNDKLFFSDFILKILNNPPKEINEKKDLKFTDAEIQKIKDLIIFKNNNIIVINKPYGLAVQSGTKIEKSLNDYLKFLKFENEENPKLVHRLDKDTTGIIVIGRNKNATEELSNFFKEKGAKLDKIYITLVVGKLKNKEGTINFPLIKKVENGVEKVYKDEKNGKEAITMYKELGYSEKFNISLLAVKILTGRTHQIRVHLKEIGHPILCDGKYGGKKSFIGGFGEKLFLHSYILRIKKFMGENIEIKADIPLKFSDALKKMRIKLIDFSF